MRCGPHTSSVLMATRYLNNGIDSGIGGVIIGDHNKIRGMNVIVKGNHNHISGMKITVDGNHNCLSGMMCVAYGSDNTSSGMMNQLNPSRSTKPPSNRASVKSSSRAPVPARARAPAPAPTPTPTRASAPVSRQFTVQTDSSYISTPSITNIKINNVLYKLHSDGKLEPLKVSPGGGNGCVSVSSYTFDSSFGADLVSSFSSVGADDLNSIRINNKWNYRPIVLTEKVNDVPIGTTVAELRPSVNI